MSDGVHTRIYAASMLYLMAILLMIPIDAFLLTDGWIVLAMVVPLVIVAFATLVLLLVRMLITGEEL